MFEKILVKPRGLLKYRQSIIDLIDLLLYYDEIHIIVDPENFVGFYRTLGEDLVEELIRSQRIILHPTDSQLGCNVTDDGYYGITFVSHGWDDIHRLLYEFHNRLIADDKIKSKHFADRFSPMLETFSYPNAIGHCIYNDLLNSNYISKALDTYLQIHHTSYHTLLGQAKMEIELSDTNYFPNAFKVRHNLDEVLATTIKGNKKFDVYPFLLSVSDSRISSYMAAQYGSEINTSYENSKLIMLQLNHLIRDSNNSKENINAFHKHIIHDCLSVGEAYADKKIDDKKLVDILNEAGVLRNWLKNLPKESSLISEYISEITRKNIADNTWFKVSRTIIYSIISLWGPIGATVGTSLSILDSVYMDKLSLGWKPNLFVESLSNKLNT